MWIVAPIPKIWKVLAFFFNFYFLLLNIYIIIFCLCATCCMSKVTFHLLVTPKATDAPNENYPTGRDLVNQNNSKRKFSPNPSERKKKLFIEPILPKHSSTRSLQSIGKRVSRTPCTAGKLFWNLRILSVECQFGWRFRE